MVRFFAQHGIQEWLPCGPCASAWRFNSHKDCVNLRKFPWVIAAKCPTATGFTVHVQNTEAYGLRRLALCCVFLTPCLERIGISWSRVLVKIERVKDQGFSFRIKNASKRLSSPAAAVHVKNIRDVQIPSTHQFANVAV